jgi:hypothetical protein
MAVMGTAAVLVTVGGLSVHRSLCRQPNENVKLLRHEEEEIQ